MAERLLTRDFFARDPRRVARELLGKLLVRRERGRLRAGRIVEVEAYMGVNDPAAHSAAGVTDRTRVIFGPPGHAYVYFIYGNHYCLNVTCELEGKAGCVLIRALEPVAGIEAMARARGVSPEDWRRLTTGPGRLAEAFDITRPRDNGKDLVSPRSGLAIVDDGFPSPRVELTTRIGITKAADRKLRYIVSGNRYVSR